MRAAVIGAGMAGLNLARRLSESGVDVQLFEKARGPSGRLSTRRTEVGQFDHGAQYLTARDPDFQLQVEDWLARGVVQKWVGRFVRLGLGKAIPEDAEIDRLVGQPRMSAIARDLLGDRPIELGVRIESARRTNGRWTLRTDGGSEYANFDSLLLAVPAPQAIPFLGSSPALCAVASRVRMLPCHAVMATFEDPLNVDFDGAFVEAPELSWVARNSSKPGREPEPCWLLHSRAEWSADHLELDSAEITRELVSAFERSLGSLLPELAFSATHRWLYARAVAPSAAFPLWDPSEQIGVCGDWCGGDRVEDAYLSAERLAEQVRSSISAQ
jgi:renalase